MVGRNDPCPCGSGSKYKKCCLAKAVDCGPCDAPAGFDRCGAGSCGAVECRLCGKRYARCHRHHAEVQQMLHGHVLRTHPEMVPRIVDKLARNPVELAGVLEQARRAPELWSKLVAELEKRRPAVS